jgi:G:T-mismatch repair DNA endonuclease (very short patch repair protein)
MNPKMFAPTDIVHFYTGDDIATNVWDRDRIRTSHIESFGFEVIILWESDIKKNFNEIKNMLLTRFKNFRGFVPGEKL